MTTHEERLNNLERRVAKIEFEHLSEKKIAPTTNELDALYDAQQVNHRLTMLLGIVTGHESALKSLTYELHAFQQVVSDRFDQVDSRFDAQEAHFDMHQKSIHSLEQNVHSLEQNVHSLEQNVHSLEQNMNARFGTQDKRFDAIDARFDRLETLILDRLPLA